MKIRLANAVAIAFAVLMFVTQVAAETNFEMARSALLAGDPERAESLLSGSGEAAGLRLLGEARELQGDIKGAASAYERAAAKSEGPVAEFLAQRSKILNQTAESVAIVVGAGLRPAPTERATPRTVPSVQPTLAPTPLPSAAPSMAPTVIVTQAPTALVTAAPTLDQAKADAEKEALAKEREDLEREKRELAEEKKKLAEKAAAREGMGRRGNQGFTLLLGSGAYWNDGVSTINEYAKNAAQFGGNGPRRVSEVVFPHNFGVGLRWAGFNAEFNIQALTAEYEAQGNMNTYNQYIDIMMENYAIGYDWAPLRLGSGVNITEFLLPLRLEYVNASMQVADYQASVSAFGPALGLGFRWLMGERFSLEGSLLYHINFSESQISMPDPSTMQISNNYSYKTDFSQDGLEARLRLGLRAF